MKKEIKTKKGFTIIEMLVSIAIFSVVIVMGMAAILSIINANRKSQSSTLVLSNLSLAIEAMTKNIRTGTNYNASGSSISFTPSSGQGTVTYFLQSGAIMRTSDNITAPITAPEVNVQGLVFSPYSGTQPAVLMKLQGLAGSDTKTQSHFYLQSLISKRLLGT